MKYGIDYGRQPGKSVFWKETGRYINGKSYETTYWDELADFERELYEGSRAPGKTLRLREQLYDTSGNSEEETPEHLQARWLSVRVLQVTGLSDLGPSSAQIRRVGQLHSYLHTLREQFSHMLPGVQFFSTEWLRTQLLHQDELEDRRAVEDYLAPSFGSAKETPRV